MGRSLPANKDDAQEVGEGTLAAAASGAWVPLSGPFNILLWGTWTGAVALEVSADGGTTAVSCQYADGSAVTFSANGHQVARGAVEASMVYRLTRGAGTGTLSWRLSR
jgi:hypothetical protein